MLWLRLIEVAGAILLAGLYSGFETGNYMLNEVRLRFRRQQGNREATLLARVLRDPQLLVFTVLVGHNLAVYIASTVVTGLYAQTGLSAHGTHMLFGFIPWNAEVAATLSLLLPIFLFAEVGPKNLFRKRANSLMYGGTRVLWLSHLLFRPVTVPLRLLTRMIPGSMESDAGAELVEVTRRRLHVFFTEGASEGVLTTHQTGMVANVMNMNRRPLRRVMRPIGQAPCLPENATVADFKRLARDTDVTRISLYRSRPANIIGYVHLFDVMGATGDDAALAPLRRDGLSLGPEESVHDALRQLRRAHQSMAVVRLADGTAVGQVSLEQLVGHIVGQQ